MLGAATMAVIGLMGFGLWYKDNQVQAQAEQIGAQIGVIEGQKAQIDYLMRAGRENRDFNERVENLNASFDRERQEARAEIERWRRSAERRALDVPKDFGDSVDIDLRLRMCLIENTGNAGGREACRDLAASAPPATIALTITVTSDEAERWRELCDDGDKRFCDWSITGFTPQGLATFNTWLTEVDGWSQETYSQLIELRRFVEREGD